MDRILIFIKKCIPQRIFCALQPWYHFVLNFCAVLRYNFPSRRMTVVGITGTTGKTTITFLLAHLLRSAGMRVGYTSTALISDGKSDWLNDKKMTMLGRFFTQKILAQMAKNKCDVAIVETTSEGIVQYRHRFINYDVVLFTGIYPEHIESHGSFENYKAAKLKLFTHLAQCGQKHDGVVDKTIIVNGDDEHAQDFLAPWAQQKVVFAQNESNFDSGDAHMYKYTYTETNTVGVKVSFDDVVMQTPLLGIFSATNIAAAASIARTLGLSNAQIAQGVQNLPDVPGRMERIVAPDGFKVIVDYAFEPVAMKRLYETVALLAPQRIIHVLGGTGGGRDRARRPQIGAIAGAQADIVIVTDEDPYDEDPQEIMEDVAGGVRSAGKVLGKDFWIIPDRADAIVQALSFAHKDDIVLITGKGCEQAICLANGKKKKHDDRAVVHSAVKSASVETS